MNPTLGAIAAILGGVFWIIKSGAILVAGEQPPFLFEAAPLLFAFGVVGLYYLLPDRVGAVGRGGSIVAVAAALLTVGALVVTEGGTEVTSDEEFSPLTFLSFVGTLVALLLVGIPTRSQRSLRPPWHLLPLVLFASYFPLLAIGGLLESIDERLLEIPILILGAEWVLLGYAMLSARAFDDPGPTGIARPSK